MICLLPRLPAWCRRTARKGASHDGIARSGAVGDAAAGPVPANERKLYPRARRAGQILLASAREPDLPGGAGLPRPSHRRAQARLVDGERLFQRLPLPLRAGADAPEGGVLDTAAGAQRDAPRRIKHRTLLAVVYGCGLRVSEAVRVQPRHIDRGRGMLFVECGKGRKDRYTILPDRALDMLGDHWRENCPFDYFFYGCDKSLPMAVGTAQSVYRQALERSGVRRVGGIHVLRHCFATHLMEAGAEIYTIRRWMGHSRLSTTGRYMHVTAEMIRKTQSPLDTLGELSERYKR